MKYLNKAMLLLLALAFQSPLLAKADIPAVRITCQSNNPQTNFQLTGEFHEFPNRHGEGRLHFNAFFAGDTVFVNAIGRSWAVDQIEYQDNLSQAIFMDAKYYAGNVSSLTVNGHTYSMICEFRSAFKADCASRACHQNGH